MKTINEKQLATFAPLVFQARIARKLTKMLDITSMLLTAITSCSAIQGVTLRQKHYMLQLKSKLYEC